DEVTYLMDVNPGFVGTLQKAWDHWLSDSNLMLALSGSQMGLMQKKILAYDAPLYGRDTAQVRLSPMPFSATKKFFPGYSAADRVAIYTMWGGVPAYWERLDHDLSVMENLQRQLMPYQSWMIDESRTLLQDFITEPHNYVAVLRAIADGLQSLGEISERAGLSGNHTSFYLSVLRDAGFVQREVPISQLGQDSRRGRYFVVDPFLRFYYRFLANTWQELSRTWLLEASANGEFPVPVESVGSEWKRNFMVDVVGLDNESKSIVLGDCFWREEPVGLESIQDLVRKTGSALPNNSEWNIYYVIFSASGWTAEAEEKAQSIIEAAASRRRRSWRPVGIRLVDLKQLDEDLDRWANR
ncbi:MAG: ATP-binding protein, partial [Chloroflexota bacterium]